METLSHGVLYSFFSVTSCLSGSATVQPLADQDRIRETCPATKGSVEGFAAGVGPLASLADLDLLICQPIQLTDRASDLPFMELQAGFAY